LPTGEQFEQIAFDICYFMNGGVQYPYLIHEIDIVDFLQLSKFANKLSNKQQAEYNKSSKKK